MSSRGKASINSGAQLLSDKRTLTMRVEELARDNMQYYQKSKDREVQDSIIASYLVATNHQIQRLVNTNIKLVSSLNLEEDKQQEVRKQTLNSLRDVRDSVQELTNQDTAANENSISADDVVKEVGFVIQTVIDHLESWSDINGAGMAGRMPNAIEERTQKEVHQIVEALKEVLSPATDTEPCLPEPTCAEEPSMSSVKEEQTNQSPLDPSDKNQSSHKDQDNQWWIPSSSTPDVQSKVKETEELLALSNVELQKSMQRVLECEEISKSMELKAADFEKALSAAYFKLNANKAEAREVEEKHGEKIYKLLVEKSQLYDSLKELHGTLNTIKEEKKTMQQDLIDLQQDFNRAVKQKEALQKSSNLQDKFQVDYEMVSSFNERLLAEKNELIKDLKEARREILELGKEVSKLKIVPHGSHPRSSMSMNSSFRDPDSSTVVDDQHRQIFGLKKRLHVTKQEKKVLEEQLVASKEQLESLKLILRNIEKNGTKSGSPRI